MTGKHRKWSVADNLPLPQQGNGMNHTTMYTQSSTNFPKARSRFAVVTEPLIQSKSNCARVSHGLVAITSSSCNCIGKILNTCKYMVRQTGQGWGRPASSRHSEETVFIATLAWHWCSDHMQVSQELKSSYLTFHLPRTPCNNTDIPEDAPCQAEVCANHTFLELTEVGGKKQVFA